MPEVLTALGAALVALVMREVFHTLFHPAGRGGATLLVFRAVWSASGRLGERARDLAGPLSMVLVIALWVVGMVAGWALVYDPVLPQRFILAAPLDEGSQQGFAAALYFSWVTQSTLGFGDVAPRDDALRILVALQATLGFGLFTMAVTWVLSIYPALHRQRSAAGLAHGIQDAHRRHGRPPAELPQTALARELERLAEALSTAHTDFRQYPSTFYFQAPARAHSLAAALEFVVELARADGLADEARLPARELESVVEQLLGDVGERLLGLDDPTLDEALAAYRRHALRPAAASG